MLELERLQGFIANQKIRYHNFFWYEVFKTSKKTKVVFMTENLAQQARLILKNKKIGNKDFEITSFENDDSIGNFYVVNKEVITALTHPSEEEYRNILGEKPNKKFVSLINDFIENETLRIFKPTGFNFYAIVSLHSFDNLTPKALGWIKNLKDVKKLKTKKFIKPKKLQNLNDLINSLKGIPYTTGGKSIQHGFDCSGLTQKIIYETQGIWFPRKASLQATVCQDVKFSDLKIGDLIFFTKKEEKRIDHVALVYKTDYPKLPIIFHTRLKHKSQLEDLNKAQWFKNYKIEKFGRVKISYQ
jgi:hypothetical protein